VHFCTVFLQHEIFLVNGVADVYQQLHYYMLLWTWPARISSHTLHENFSAGKKDGRMKANHIKCQASVMLSLCPVIAMFVQTVLMKVAADLEICKPS